MSTTATTAAATTTIAWHEFPRAALAAGRRPGWHVAHLAPADLSPAARQVLAELCGTRHQIARLRDGSPSDGSPSWGQTAPEPAADAYLVRDSLGLPCGGALRHLAMELWSSDQAAALEQLASDLADLQAAYDAEKAARAAAAAEKEAAAAADHAAAEAEVRQLGAEGLVARVHTTKVVWCVPGISLHQYDRPKGAAPYISGLNPYRCAPDVADIYRAAGAVLDQRDAGQKAAQEAAAAAAEAQRKETLADAVARYGDDDQRAAWAEGLLRTAEAVDLLAGHWIDAPLAAASIECAPHTADLRASDERIQSIDRVSTAAYRALRQVRAALAPLTEAGHQLAIDLERLSWDGGRCYTAEITATIGGVEIRRRVVLATEVSS